MRGHLERAPTAADEKFGWRSPRSGSTAREDVWSNVRDTLTGEDPRRRLAMVFGLPAAISRRPSGHAYSAPNRSHCRNPAGSSTGHRPAAGGPVLNSHAPDVVAPRRFDIPVDGKPGEVEERWWCGMSSPGVGTDGDVKWIIARADDVTELMHSPEAAAVMGMLRSAARTPGRSTARWPPRWPRCSSTRAVGWSSTATPATHRRSCSARTAAGLSYLRGDTLVLYTDGLIERRDEDIDIGLSRLIDALARCGTLPVEELADRLLARMGVPGRWSGR